MEITRLRVSGPNTLPKQISRKTEPSSPAGISQNGSTHQIKAPAKASKMMPRLESRLPIFEIALLLVATALGWGALHIYTTLNAWDRPAARKAPAQDTQ